MKRLFSYFTLALMAFAAVSCHKSLDEEKVETPVVEYETVVFDVVAPGGNNTRTSYGETLNFVPQLNVAVYMGSKNTSGVAGTYLKDVNPVITRKGNTEWSVSVRLVKNSYYDIVFWAQKENAPYTINWANATVTADYSVAANDISRDAFYFVCKDYNYVVDQTAAFDRNIVLGRPFAQINVGASDYSELLAFYEFIGKKETDLATSISTVSAQASVPSVLHLLTGEADTPVQVGFALAPVTVKDGYDLVAVENDFNVGGVAYTLVGSNYIFANVEKPQNPTVDMLLTFAYNGQSFDIKAPNVPYVRNFQTNILGKFFTEDVEFEVVVSPGFGGDLYPGI